MSVIHDSPLSDEVNKIVQYYRILAREGLGLDHLVNDCLSLVADGHGSSVLLELGGLKASLEYDKDVLISESYLLELLAEWRKEKTLQPNNEYGQRNIHLDMPIDEWIRCAWDTIEKLQAATEVAISAVIEHIGQQSGVTDEPPDCYSPLARLLYPYRKHFSTDLTSVVDVFRRQKGHIAMATSTKSVGALVLETIRIGLNITESDVLRKITVSFPEALKVSEEQEPRSWFTTKNELNNIVNTTRQSPRPSTVFTVIDSKMSALLDDIRKLTGTL